jgi:enoyl-CoA hydratase
MGNDTILVEREGYVGTLIFNRPEKRNALTPGAFIKIYETLEEFAKDDNVRTIIFKGAGDKAFCAGYDISAIPTKVPPEVQKVLKTTNALELALARVQSFPYPTIAMMNGFTFGAGFNLAMCCDIRVGVDDIRMGMPPVKLGLIYHPEGLKQFLDVLGMARTKEVFLTARTYRGSEAREKGLVDYLIPRDELESFTRNLAFEISKNAPLSLKGTKKILNMFLGARQLSEADYAETQNLIGEAFNSDDLKEGQMAFLEKREPKFTGK